MGGKSQQINAINLWDCLPDENDSIRYFESRHQNNIEFINVNGTKPHRSHNNYDGSWSVCQAKVL